MLLVVDFVVVVVFCFFVCVFSLRCFVCQSVCNVVFAKLFCWHVEVFSGFDFVHAIPLCDV